MVILGVLTLVMLVLVLGSRANDKQLGKLIGSTSTRRYDAGSIEVVDAESTSLVPYQPQPKVIRIDTHRLPQAQTQPIWEASKSMPTRVPRMESDFRVPMAQAMFTAFAFGVMAGLMAWALEWSWRVPVFVMGLSLGLSWLWRLRLIDSLLWKVESITRTDLTGDGAIGQPEPQVSYTLANPAQARSEAAQAARSNAGMAESAELMTFVSQCALHGCSESALGVKPSPSARAKYCQQRDMLISLGIGAWKDSTRRKLGWQLVTTKEQAESIITKHVMAR